MSERSHQGFWDGSRNGGGCEEGLEVLGCGEVFLDLGVGCMAEVVEMGCFDCYSALFASSNVASSGSGRWKVFQSVQDIFLHQLHPISC